MKYEEIRRLKIERQSQASKLSMKIQTMRDELQTIEQSMRDISARLDQDIAIAERAALSEAINKAVSPLELEYSQVLQQLRNLDVQHAEALQSCNPETIFTELSNKDSVLSEIREASEQVLDLIGKSVGPRFTQEYVKHLQTSEFYFNKGSSKDLLDRFHSVRSQLEKSLSRNKVTVVDKIEAALTEVTKDKVQGDLKGASTLTAVLSVIMLVTAWVTFPVYLGFLFYVAAKNIRNGVLYSRTLLEYKAVIDNIDKLESGLRQEAQASYESTVRKLEEDYKNEKADLEHKADTVRMNIETTRERVQKTFVFDSSDLERTAQITKQEMEGRKRSLEASIEKSLAEVEVHKTEILNLTKQMQDVVEGVRGKYMDLTELENNDILDPKFLIDIVDDKPIYLDYPLDRAAVFLYDDLSEANNLVKLLSVQLRKRLNPINLRIQLWDKDNMGSAFGSFVRGKSKLFSIAPSFPEMEERLDGIYDLLLKRLNMFSGEYKNLNEYNNAMKEMDSLTETFHFCFIMNFPQKFCSNDKINQAIRVGPSLGVYMNMLISLSELNEAYLPLFTDSVSIYVLNNGKLNKKAPNWALESLSTFGK